MTQPETNTLDSAVVRSGATERSRAQLFGRAARAASGFEALGVEEATSVALCLRNDLAFLEATLAARTLGAYAVPVNWHFTAEEAGYILRDCEARVLVVHADLLAGIEAAIPTDVSVIVVSTPPEVRDAYAIAPERCVPPVGRPEWQTWLEQHAAWAGDARRLRGSMIYTSGTTGQPKGVRREPATPPMQQVTARTLAHVFGFVPGEPFRAVITGPMYHAAPNAYALSAIVEGGTLILQPRFDAEDLLRLVEHYRITHLHMVPTMFVRLLKLPEHVKRAYDVSSLRFIVHAGAPCPSTVKRQMIEWWGPVINEYYGGTETGAAVFHTAEEALRKPGTVGRPVEGAIVKVFDPQGKPLGPYEVGEVYARITGSADFTYQGRDDARREVEREGLITCGDLGYLDEDGYVFLCDRLRDMVISGGVNIYPAEIEAALITMPGVRDCAVFGIPDEVYGEAVCACVEADDAAALSPEAIREFLRGHLAGYKVPRRIEFTAALPREDSGKVFKRKLRDPYWRAAGRQI